jgi:hypothetical protein
VQSPWWPAGGLRGAPLTPAQTGPTATPVPFHAKQLRRLLISTWLHPRSALLQTFSSAELPPTRLAHIIDLG